MGNLTVVTFHNDLIEDTTNDPKKLADIIKGHASGACETKELNGIKLFRSVHSRDNALYVSSGNTVCEMFHWSDETERLIKNHPEFFREMLNYIKEEVKNLEGRYNELQR